MMRYLKSISLCPSLWPLILTLGLCLGVLATGCSKKNDEAKKISNATLVSTTVARKVRMEIREESVGTLESLIDPIIASEVPARVLNILVRPGQAVTKGQAIAILDNTDFTLQQREAQAEVARIEALLANQGLTVERNRKLVDKNFISKNALDDATTQQAALREQLDGARAKVASISNTGSKTRVVAPIDGVVQKQIVSVGDFVKIGDPMLQIISTQRLRVHLPFPESAAAKLRPGLSVRLSTPTSPTPVTATVTELKPLIESANLAVDVIADVTGQTGWQPGASVNGAVILGQRDEALVVPEQSIILRPAGEVVYVVRNNSADQRIVKTGLRQEGLVEILEGLNAGEEIAVDGAGFLTDRAAVAVQPNTMQPSQKP